MGIMEIMPLMRIIHMKVSVYKSASLNKMEINQLPLALSLPVWLSVCIKVGYSDLQMQL